MKGRDWALTRFQCPNPATATDIHGYLVVMPSQRAGWGIWLYQARKEAKRRIGAPRIAPRRSGVRVPLAPSQKAQRSPAFAVRCGRHSRSYVDCDSQSLHKARLLLIVRCSREFRLVRRGPTRAKGTALRFR